MYSLPTGMFVRNGFEKKVAAACSHILADEILPERERFLLTNTYTLQTYFNSLVEYIADLFPPYTENHHQAASCKH